MTASIGAVWRQEATRPNGALLRARADLALAEDHVQDGLVAAMQHWPAKGWPERPATWRMTAAKYCLSGRRRLRVNGEVHVSEDDPLLAETVGAQLIVRVTVRAMFRTARDTHQGCR